MPLGPPYEDVSFTTRVGYSDERKPGSYNGAYFTHSIVDIKWYRRTRSWVRAPKGSRHLTNPYSSYRFQMEPLGQYIFTWQNLWYGTYYDTIVHNGTLSPSGDMEGWGAARTNVSSTDPLLTHVRNSVLKQAAGQTFNAALFAAEAHKTLDLLFSNAAKIARSFREIKRGRVMGQSLKETIRKACSAIGVVQSKKWDPKASRGSQWLEYRYGVETLMMDVRDAAEYAASKMSDQPERYTWRSKKTASTAAQIDYPPDTMSLWGTIQSSAQWPTERRFHTQITAQAWLTAELETAGYRSMQQLGFANPLGLAWELIPFSFVVDWALGIGSYLDMQSSLWGLKIVDAGYSMQCDGYTVLTGRPAPGNSGGYNTPYINPGYSGAISVRAKNNRYQRWKWQSPSPEYTLGSGLNLKRCLDAAALFQGFSRR